MSRPDRAKVTRAARVLVLEACAAGWKQMGVADLTLSLAVALRLRFRPRTPPWLRGAAHLALADLAREGLVFSRTRPERNAVSWYGEKGIDKFYALRLGADAARARLADDKRR